ARAVAHQATRYGEIAILEDRGNCVARRERGKLLTPSDKERIGTDQQSAGLHSDERLEDCVDLTGVARMKDCDALADGTRRLLDLALLARGVGKGGIHNHGNEVGIANEIAENHEPLRTQRGGEKRHARHIAARPIETVPQSDSHRVGSASEHDRNRRSGGLCRKRCRGAAASRRCDHCHATANQIGGKRGQPIALAQGPAILDRHVSPPPIACILQTSAECGDQMRGCFGRLATQEADHRYRGLLCARRDRPRYSRGAAEQHECAPVHSITSSARASSDVGRSSPSAFAVLRLITSSYLVGAWTGSLAGFSPLRIRTTYPAARRYWSMKSAP